MPMSAEVRYSLIIPVYKNEATIRPLLAALEEISTALGAGSFEAVFVIDGSPDLSYQVLKLHLPNAPFRSLLVCLSRNFGSFSAIRMGLEVAKGQYFAVMAADLQEPPELIVKFFVALSQEPVDITIGVREMRNDPLASAFAANLFWWLYRRLVQREVSPGGADVFGCNRAVRDALLKIQEANSTLIGLVYWLGFRRREIPYVRQARAAGKSAWTLTGKVRYLLDSIFAFTDLPITILIVIGLVGIAGSLIAGVVIFIAWLSGVITVRGYTPLALLLLTSFSVMVLGLGIVGSYVWRAFENTKHRPLYVPMLQEAFDGTDPP